jgi:16S rRNA (adenine1518-N6/adenine1519-N6)-dimethyltransferase
MSLLLQLQSIFSKYHLRPVKFRGQNFLIDENVLDKIIRAAEIKSSDTILEIGPGLGFLTERLIARAKKVIAVELDTRLCGVLKDRFKDVKNLEIINQDILKINIRHPDPRSRSGEGSLADAGIASSGEILPPHQVRGQNDGKNILSSCVEVSGYKVVANIPYEITSLILHKFLTCALRPQEMVLMVQKEVAERIIGKKQSYLSVLVGLYGKPEIAAIVPKTAFYPIPKIDSATVKIGVKEFSYDERKSAESALKLAKIGFAHPRKKVLGNLSGGLHIKKEKIAEIFKKVGLNEGARAEELVPNKWLELVQNL